MLRRFTSHFVSYDSLLLILQVTTVYLSFSKLRQFTSHFVSSVPKKVALYDILLAVSRIGAGYGPVTSHNAIWRVTAQKRL